jgi:hypothetical protein
LEGVNNAILKATALSDRDCNTARSRRIGLQVCCGKEGKGSEDGGEE